MWKIEFFDEKVMNDTFSLPKKILAKMLRVFEIIEQLRPQLGEPYTKHLFDGLFEVRAKRAKGQEGIGRSIFCYQKDKKNNYLALFCKKRPKNKKKRFGNSN